MADPNLKMNKDGNRPHYYCFRDGNTGVYWMIPLSSKINKYKVLMEQREKSGKPCDILHIVKLANDKESVFLIQDMFPITEKYIDREYTIAGNHLILTKNMLLRRLNEKPKKLWEC